MTDQDAAVAALQRVQRIQWRFDDAHTRTYVALIRKFLDRALQLSWDLGRDTYFPFFDVCEAAGLTEELPDDLVDQFTKWAACQPQPRHHVLDVCRWHVRASYLGVELRACAAGAEQIYEPLMTLFDMGGYFRLEHTFVIVGIASVPFGRRAAPPSNEAG